MQQHDGVTRREFVVSTTGAGVSTVTGAGPAVGCASCDQAGVEDSARAAAIAGRALAYAYRLVFHIMGGQQSSPRFGCAIIAHTSRNSDESLEC